MNAVHVRSHHSVFRLPASGTTERPRLDSILHRSIVDAFSSVADDIGAAPDSEVCIREVSLPLPVNLSTDDQTIADAWRRALADGLREELRSARVVRYESRTQALIDFARSVATGDLRRAWAWRLLGFGNIRENSPASEAAAFVASALCREPLQIIPVLTWLGTLDLLVRLMVAWSPGTWSDLARAAAAGAAGVDVGRWRFDQSTSPGRAAIDDGIGRKEPSSQNVLGMSPSPGDDRTIAAASRILTHSTIARAAFAVRGVRTRFEIDTLRGIALLAVLEVEPVLLRRDPQTVRSLVDGLSGHLARDAVSPSGSPDPASRFEADPSSRADSLTAVDPASAMVSVRRHLFTEWAGLLFLIRVMDRLRLPDEIVATEPLRDRPFRWVLYQLGRALIPAGADDPALFAFAGLSPDSTSPIRREPRVTDSERMHIGHWAARIVIAVGSALGCSPDDAREGLLRLCRRRAEIVAEPGWVSVRMSSSQVDTIVRRAGLDLDPGYVSWLGIVLKFAYV